MCLRKGPIRLLTCAARFLSRRGEQLRRSRIFPAETGYNRSKQTNPLLHRIESLPAQWKESLPVCLRSSELLWLKGGTYWNLMYYYRSFDIIEQKRSLSLLALLLCLGNKRGKTKHMAIVFINILGGG